MKAFALEATDKPASVISLPKPEVGEDGISVRPTTFRPA